MKGHAVFNIEQVELDLQQIIAFRRIMHVRFVAQSRARPSNGLSFITVPHHGLELPHRSTRGLSDTDRKQYHRLAEIGSSFFRRHMTASLPLPESHTKSFSTFGRSKPQFHRPDSQRFFVAAMRETVIRQADMNIPTDERTSFDGHGRGGESECARAMAEAEKVLRELALCTRRSKAEPSNGANKPRKAPPLVPAPTPIDRVVLDPGLDFVFHKDGLVELTGAGFRRMAQAHSAAIDVVIGIDGREVLRFPAQRGDGINALPEKEISDLRALPGKQCYGHIIGTRFPKI